MPMTPIHRLRELYGVCGVGVIIGFALAILFIVLPLIGRKGSKF